MAVTYSSDIKPKFRGTDIDCMKRRHIMLDDSSWMCSAAAAYGFPDHGNARHVYAYLSDGSMPPDGVWPQNWMDSYTNWMNGGFKP